MITDSEKETREIGIRLAKALTPGSVVALYGDLGSGKTVLTRGIARGLGITEPVTSPTFTIVQEYQCPDNSWLFHLDMYRIDNEESALAFGIEEFLFSPDAITVIEWPERIEDLLKQPSELSGEPTVNNPGSRVPTCLQISLEHVSESRRRLRLPDELRASHQPLPAPHQGS